MVDDVVGAVHDQLRLLQDAAQPLREQAERTAQVLEALQDRAPQAAVAALSSTQAEVAAIVDRVRDLQRRAVEQVATPLPPFVVDAEDGEGDR